MATVTNSVVAEGQIASSEGDLYAATASGHFNLYILSTHASDQTVLLYIQKSGGTSRNVKRVVLSQNYSAEWLGFRLGNGDKLRASTTNATSVNFVVESVVVV